MGIGEDERVLGRFKASGIRPKFTERLKAYGIDLSALLFLNQRESGSRAAGGGRW